MWGWEGACVRVHLILCCVCKEASLARVGLPPCLAHPPCCRLELHGPKPPTQVGKTTFGDFELEVIDPVADYMAVLKEVGVGERHAARCSSCANRGSLSWRAACTCMPGSITGDCGCSTVSSTKLAGYIRNHP